MPFESQGLEEWEDPGPPSVDPLMVSDEKQQRFNTKSMEVKASFGGANGAHGLLEPLCTKIEEMLQKHRKELLSDILERDRLLFHRVEKAEMKTHEARLSQVHTGNAVLSQEEASLSQVGISSRPSQGQMSEMNGAAESTDGGRTMNNTHSIRFSTRPHEVYQVKSEVEAGNTISARDSEATTHRGSENTVAISTIGHALDVEAEDEERRKEALELDAKESEMEYEDEELAEQLAVVQAGWRRKILKCVASSEFELTFAVLIITNSVFIGVQVDWASRNPGDANPTIFHVLQNLYAAVFTVELVIRLLAEGTHYFCSSQWHWNFLDLFLVTASLFEVFTEMLAALSTDSASMQNMSNVRILRIVRVARLMRIFRILRVVRFIRGLRTLLFSIMCTLKSLVWAMLLLLIIIYVFGILFTQAVTDYLPESMQVSEPSSDPSTHEEILHRYYGTLLTSMYTLFESVAGGLSWGIHTRALNDVSFLCNVVFTAYVAFVYFAVLNVVTGVFCHAAIESAQHDHDMVIQQQLTNKQAYVQKVRSLFEDLDSDASGTITLTEFEKHFQDESVQAYFSSLDLDPKDAWTLFKLLDTTCTHQVNIEEFALGCLRLRGSAKRIDMERLLYDQQRMLRGLAAFSTLVEQQLGTIAGETARLTATTAGSGGLPQRSSLLAARDVMDELKDLANTGIPARYKEMSQMPAKKNKKRKQRRPSVASTLSDGHNSRKSSLTSSITTSSSSHVRWGLFASAPVTL